MLGESIVLYMEYIAMKKVHFFNQQPFTCSPLFDVSLWFVLSPAHFCINNLTWETITEQNIKIKLFFRTEVFLRFLKAQFVCFLTYILCCVGVCAPAAPFISLQLCVFIWVRVAACMCYRRDTHMHTQWLYSSSVFRLFKGMNQASPAGLCVEVKAIWTEPWGRGDKDLMD